MEGLDKQQATVVAKAIAVAWDELPDAGEQEFGEKSEAKANQALAIALSSPEVIDAGIRLEDDQRDDLRGQFHVFLEDASSWGDISRMEDGLAELFAAD